MAARGRHNGGNRKLRQFIFNPKHEVETFSFKPQVQIKISQQGKWVLRRLVMAAGPPQWISDRNQEWTAPLHSSPVSHLDLSLL